MQRDNLEKTIEAILFFRGEPVSRAWLSKTLKKSDEEIDTAIKTLEQGLLGRGIVLLEVNDTITLATSPDVSQTLEAIAKEELERDLGKASLETLSLILYRGPITKTDIDYIRGVNSNFILRALLIRGLIEREKNPEDPRGFLYKPTADLLAFMGLTAIHELPEYEHYREEIKKFEASFENTQDKEFKTQENKEQEHDEGKETESKENENVVE